MILSEDNGGTYQGMSASHGIIPTTFMVQETQKTENHDPNLACLAAISKKLILRSRHLEAILLGGTWGPEDSKT